ncbi:unnamed protein product [Mytilus edulis]|uniref:DZIP3-like HEPN domain-containing protein n=1 Tax=Mytilus edulis TaxID=6550 RepID=A0A8S3RIP3_MYTED|nr:unnamed protein product [Mytilus edulis]
MNPRGGIQTTDGSPEDDHFPRFSKLINNYASTAVRVKFDEEFNSSCLQKVLNQNKYKILEPLKRKRVINQAQWVLLFPISGDTSSKNYDLTLMICLLKNLANITVGDILPFNGDKSVGADLTRLKYYRNKIMHEDDCISAQFLDKGWDQISQAIVRLGGISFEERCNQLKVRKCECTDKDMLKEIKNISRTCDRINKGTRKICQETQSEWEKEEVVETKVIRRLNEMISTDNAAVAVGPSGCGKSTAIHYIALQLAQKQKFDIVIINEPKEMKQLYNPDRKQVFVIDDVLGIATFEEKS